MERLAEPFASVRHRQGRLLGHMEALGFHLQQEAVLQTLTADVLKSREIEGEMLDAGQVRTSISRTTGERTRVTTCDQRRVETRRQSETAAPHRGGAQQEGKESGYPVTS